MSCIWNLGLAAVLVWLGRHRQIRPPGLFALYVAGYSGFRIFEELLRTDPAHHVLGLRLNFFVATVLCLTGLVWFARTQRSGNSRRRLSRGGPAALGVGLLVMTASGCTHAAAPRHAPAGRSPRPRSLRRDLNPGELPGAGDGGEAEAASLLRHGQELHAVVLPRGTRLRESGLRSSRRRYRPA